MRVKTRSEGVACSKAAWSVDYLENIFYSSSPATASLVVTGDDDEEKPTWGI
jgi:hypothetical protein